MKISINYLKKYLDFELPPIDVLIERIGSQLGAIDEGVIDLWEIYNQVIVVKIVECTPIEGSDHLNLCLIEDNRQFSDDSIRQPDGKVQVVCGAPNVAKDQLVAWLPPSTVVPSTFFKDKVTLESKELHGHISHGMIPSSKELMIDDDHSGILQIDKSASPGDSFAKLYELDDYVIDIENKMFTHRPDCFGLLGIARELSGILNKPFTSPKWYADQPNIAPAKKDLTITVHNEIPSLVPRFSAVAIDKLTVKQSPIQTKSYLARMGIRPINSIVDATNLAMLETGQPLHAYDFTKLQSVGGSNEVNLTIRNPKSEESIELINEKTVTPSSNSIVIASGQPVGLGGIMGATNSAISEQTKTIVLEAATFDMYSIRRTSMELGIFSDAVTRFTKGQSPFQNTRVLVRSIELLRELCGAAEIASDLTDDNHIPEATMKRGSLHPDIKIGSHYINDRLGTELSIESMANLLRNVECQVEESSEELIIKAPFWRTDIEIREDAVEEIGRLYGFDNIKLSDLSRSVKPVKTDSLLGVKARIRWALQMTGANEALTYSFVSKRLINDCSQDETRAYQLQNALSPEVAYFRMSIIPSLLNKVNANIKAGYQSFSLFEIGAYHLIEEDLPNDHNSVALVFASSESSSEPSYYQARAFLDFALSDLRISKVDYLPLRDHNNKLPSHLTQAAEPFDPERSAIVSLDQQILGIVGEFRSEVRRRLKLPANCAGFEVDLELFSKESSKASYHKLSKFPAIKQDMTLKLPASSSYAQLEDLLEHQLKHHLGDSGFFNIELLSVYQAKEATDFTNYAFRISIADYSKTLKDPEVNDLLDKVAQEATDKLQAVRV